MGAGRIFWIVTSVAALTGCAAPGIEQRPRDPAVLAEEQRQQDLYFDALMRDHQRLTAVAHRVRIAAAPLCDRAPQWASGLTFYTQEALPPDMRQPAARWGIGDRVHVVAVVPGSGGDRAGVRPGDALVSVRAVPITRGRLAMTTASQVLSEGSEAVPIVIERQGASLQLMLEREMACPYSTGFWTSEQIGAWAAPNEISVTRGMLRFASGDAELAHAVAHELAHHVLGHVRVDGRRPQTRLGAALDDLFGAFSGAQTSTKIDSIAAEGEADYVGLYLVARAGYDVREAAGFVRRMSTVSPQSIAGSPTHPGWAERFVSLERAAAEIEAKRAAGAPLLPTVGGR